jgi:hypothetical protein
MTELKKEYCTQEQVNQEMIQMIMDRRPDLIREIKEIFIKQCGNCKRPTLEKKSCGNCGKHGRKVKCSHCNYILLHPECKEGWCTLGSYDCYECGRATLSKPHRGLIRAMCDECKEKLYRKIEKELGWR